MVEQRINSEVKIKVLIKPVNNPLGVSPSKGNQGTTQVVPRSFVLLSSIVVRQLCLLHEVRATIFQH